MGLWLPGLERLGLCLPVFGKGRLRPSGEGPGRGHDGLSPVPRRTLPVG